MTTVGSAAPGRAASPGSAPACSTGDGSTWPACWSGSAAICVPAGCWWWGTASAARSWAWPGLLDFYTQADIWHRHLKPAEVGAGEISHFGFFRDRFRETLWRDATTWLVKQAAQPVIATTSSPATANLRSPLPGRTEAEPVKAPKAGSSPTASPKMKPGSLSLWRPKPESEIAG